MAKFSDQKYIDIAVSKDLRGGLQYAYRHRDRLIGCDGHRLHMITGLAEVSEGQYVSAPKDTPEYPNYEVVLPKEEKLRRIGTLTFDKDQVKVIKGLCGFIGPMNHVCISVKEGLLHLSHDNKRNRTATYSLAGDFKGSTDKTIVAIKIQYLFDAIIEGKEMDLYCNEEQSLVLRCTYPSIMSYALIMGVNL